MCTSVMAVSGCERDGYVHQCDGCLWVMSLVVGGMVMCTSVMAVSGCERDGYVHQYDGCL